MELTLIPQPADPPQVAVHINGRYTHTFPLAPLQLGDDAPPADAVAYGRSLYRALFPPDGEAAQTLATADFILLVTSDDAIQAIAWEYAYDDRRHGGEQYGGFLVCALPFVRGLPAEQRQPPPDLSGVGLHITAVPSQPLDPAMPTLNIEGEWQRLTEVLAQTGAALTLERVRPPTIAQLRQQSSLHRHSVIHFMGHGARDDTTAALIFEKDDGSPDAVTSQAFAQRVGQTAVLVTLNACVTATPGATRFSNLAHTLVRAKLPYALGMRFSITDDDARRFSRVLYGELAQGQPISEAVHQARLALADSPQKWAVGVPVLYTSLVSTSLVSTSLGNPTAASRIAFSRTDGQAKIVNPPLPTEFLNLLGVEGVFQGRISELLKLGRWLTGDSRPHLITIQGIGGEGKTSLARAAAERFAYAFPGGVFSSNLESLPSRATLATALARFVGIATEQHPDAAQLEVVLSRRLGQKRTLIVLDNAETLLEAVDQQQAEAIALSQFLRLGLNLPTVTLLATSRRFLGWAGEEKLPLTGLTDDDGAALFADLTRLRSGTVTRPEARALSDKVGGHPLSLRLLAGVYNHTAQPFADFLKVYDFHLAQAKDTLQQPDHRHYSLNACMSMSIAALPLLERDLLSGLWLFHAPFMVETACQVLDPDTPPAGSRVADGLLSLHQRGLLTCQTPTFRQGTITLYQLPPAVRPSAQNLPQGLERDTLHGRWAMAMAGLMANIDAHRGEGGMWTYLAQSGAEEWPRALLSLSGETEARLALQWGYVSHRLGDYRQGRRLTEQALSLAEQTYPHLILDALINLGIMCQDTGNTEEALNLCNQVLLLTQEESDWDSKASVLNNMGSIYSNMGQHKKALSLYTRSLSICRKIGNRRGEASGLHNTGEAYRAINLLQEALTQFKEALIIRQNEADLAGEADTLLGIGAVYFAMKKHQEAQTFFEDALAIMKEVGDRAGEATILNNMGRLYIDIGQPQKALKCFEQALPIRQEVGDIVGETITLNNMGEIYYTRGDFYQVVQLLQKVIGIASDLKDVAREALYLDNLASVLLYALGQIRGALKYMERVVHLLESHELEYHAGGGSLAECKAFLAQLRASADSTTGGVMAAIRAFVTAQSLTGLRQVVEVNEAVLLTEQVDDIFNQNIANAQGNERAVQTLQMHQALLRACRVMGIAAAFAAYTKE